MSRNVTATMRFMLDTSSMSTGIQQVGRGLQGLDKQALTLGKTLGITFGAATVGMVLKNALSTINNYSEANSRLAAILGTVKSETTALQAVQQQLGASTKFTASQVADAQTELAKLGFTQREIAASTKGVLDLAAAANIEIARAAEIAGGTLRGFGLDAAETGRVVDVMAASFTKSALDSEKFAETMKVVAPIARVAGIDLETTSALAGQLANSMISGSIAGTGLKNLLSELSNPTSKLSKEIGFAVTNSEDLFRAFDILKDRNIDLAQATELTDERSKAAFLTLLNGTDTLKQLEEQFRNASGAAGQLAETMTDNLTGDVEKAKSAWEGFVLSLENGEGVISRALRSTVQGATELLTKFREFNEDTQIIADFGISGGDFRNIERANLALQDRLIKKANELKEAGTDNERLFFQVRSNALLKEEAKNLETLKARQKEITKERERQRQIRNTGFGKEVKDAANALRALSDEFSEVGRGIVDAEGKVNAYQAGLSAVKVEVKEVVEETTALTDEQKAAALAARDLRFELEGLKALSLNDLFNEQTTATIGGVSQGLQELYEQGVLGAGDLERALAKAGAKKNEVFDDTFGLAESFRENFDIPEIESFTANLEALRQKKEELKISTEGLNEQLQRERDRVNEIGGVLKGVFEEGIKDFSNFGQAIGDTLKGLIAQLAAAAAAAALLNLFLPGAGSFSSIFGQLSGFGSLFSGNNGDSGINVNGLIQGRDIALSSQNTGNFLNRVG